MSGSPLQRHKTAAVSTPVTTQYSQTHEETFAPELPGLKSQKLALNMVATKVPGRKRSVTAEMTRISAP
jgi:hypothetical protein